MGGGGQKSYRGKCLGFECPMGAKGWGAKGWGANDRGAKDQGAKDRGAKLISPFGVWQPNSCLCVSLG